MSADLLIRGATLFDGITTHPAPADVVIDSGLITAVGPAAAGPGARRVIDAHGLTLAPGFIDLHSHADFTLPSFPEAVNSISQGVTTEVVGNCGFSPAPVSSDPARARDLRDWYLKVDPRIGADWRGFGDFMNALDKAAPPVNVAPLVGHGALRIYAMGLDQRPAQPRELLAMREALADALQAGAWGMSSGLAYQPGAAADTAELLEVGQELRKTDAVYATHVRSEARRVVDAVSEALLIGERLDVIAPDAGVHPRCYGAFARTLAWGVREARLFSMEEAVRKMTSLAADAIGLRDRGRVAPGLVADLVLFDSEQVADHATFSEPTLTATGIEYVLVNGKLAVDGGRVTGERAGKVLPKSKA